MLFCKVMTCLTLIGALLQYKCVFFLHEGELSCYVARRKRVVACDHHHLTAKSKQL